MRTLVVGMLIACDAGSPPTPTPPPGPTQLPVSQAATTFAATFDPAVVGTLTPRPVEAGAYAMAIDLTFNSYPTTELELSDTLHGAMTLALATDGKVSACIASHTIDGSAGQWHYEEPEKRVPYHQSEVASASALTGTWKLVDGIAQITFDASGYRTCDPAKAAPMQAPVTLQCIATGATTKLPADAIACTGKSPMLEVGMPMSREERTPRYGANFDRPRGVGFVLSRTGLHVKVAQEPRAAAPTYTFTPGAVTIDPAAYVLPKKQVH